MRKYIIYTLKSNKYIIINFIQLNFCEFSEEKMNSKKKLFQKTK